MLKCSVLFSVSNFFKNCKIHIWSHSSTSKKFCGKVHVCQMQHLSVLKVPKRDFSVAHSHLADVAVKFTIFSHFNDHRMFDVAPVQNTAAEVKKIIQIYRNNTLYALQYACMSRFKGESYDKSITHKIVFV